jgi:ABC-type taurine transport system ATPase subunit
MLLWYSAMMLALDAAKVVEMRLRMMALGQSTPAEMFLMVTEKLEAMEDAGTIIIRGGDPSRIIDNYRKIVAANVARLSGS